jgi:hypothetical protein
MGVEGTSGGMEDARVELSPSLLAGFVPTKSCGTDSISSKRGEWADLDLSVGS